MNERQTATGFAAWRSAGRRLSSARRHVLLASVAGTASLLILSSTARDARAQSCPDGYAACDNGACCRSSDQCCPNSLQCCDSFAPYCCGDGTCAAEPGQCAGAVGQTCKAYEVPCGPGCAPPGSDCCDSAGHYCTLQGVCTSTTTCLAGMEVSAALLVTPVSGAGGNGARSVSPLRDPPDGSARSCAFAPAQPGGAHASSAAEMAAALFLFACWTRRCAHRPAS